MSTKKNNSLILNEIKSHYKFKKDSHFADFLGIAPTTLSSWHSRNSFDYELVYAKCGDIDGNWLLTGEGPMLRKDRDATSLVNEPRVDYGKMETIGPAQTIKDLRDSIAAHKKTIEVLEALLKTKRRNVKPEKQHNHGPIDSEST